MKKPTFFIVGAPKCGTTAMARYLGAHPDIFVPEAKELHYFADDIDNRIRVTDIDCYLQHFRDWNREAVAGEASVFHLYSESATRRIREFSPEAKIVIMLRNPVDMMYSLFYQLRFTADENLRTFEAALAAEPARLSGRGIPSTSLVPHALRYARNACYTEHVSRYLQHYGAERVQIVIFDDFKAHPDESYRAVLRYLGVNEHFTPEFPTVNASKLSWSQPLAAILRNPPGWLVSAGRWVVPESRRRSLRADLLRLNSRRVTRPPMRPETRTRLSRAFIPEVERLSRLLDRDLTFWLDER